jgi:multicomponent Na+:H+ antiporter subunit F
MTDLMLNVAVLVLVIALLLGFYRLWRGPSVVDRILAFDAVVLCAVGLTALLSRWWQSELYIELILIVSSLGFFGTVAFVYFLQRALPYGGENDDPLSGGDKGKEDAHG